LEKKDPEPHLQGKKGGGYNEKLLIAQKNFCTEG